MGKVEDEFVSDQSDGREHGQGRGAEENEADPHAAASVGKVIFERVIFFEQCAGQGDFAGGVIGDVGGVVERRAAELAVGEALGVGFHAGGAENFVADEIERGGDGFMAGWTCVGRFKSAEIVAAVEAGAIFGNRLVVVGVRSGLRLDVVGHDEISVC